MATVPMYDPSGQVRQIPAEQQQAALAAGGQPAVKMLDPTGTPRWIRQSDQQAALASGGKMAPAAPAADPGDLPPQPGMMQQYMDDVHRRATLSGVKDRLTGLIEGVHQGVNETAVGLSKLLRGTPVVGDALAQHGLDDVIAKGEKAVAGGTAPAGTERAGGQDIGRNVESMVEFMAGEGALKGMSFMQKMEQIAPFAKALKASPKVAEVLGNALRQGVTGGAQTLAKGGSGTDALESAGVQAAAGGVLEGVPTATAHLAEDVAPGTRTIAGEQIPVLASQQPGATPRQAGAASIASEPEYQAAQQQGSQKAIQNIAQRATRDSLAQLNATRPQPDVTPSRLLPAPADMQAPRFSLLTTEPTETADNGPQAGRVLPGNAGTREVPNEGYSPEGADSRRSAIGSTAEATPDRSFTGNPTRTVSNFQEAGPAPGQTAVERGGGGTVTTDDPATAHAHLAQLDDLIESDSFGRLSQRTQDRYTEAADTLRQQLDDHGKYQREMSHFQPIDPSAAAAQVTNFRDAGAVLQSGVKDVYGKLDDVSGGQWGALRKAEQAAQKTLRAPSSMDAYDAAGKRLEEIRGKQQGILTDARNSTQISEPEWRAANRAYRDGSLLNQLHGTLESSFRGVPDSVLQRNAGDPTLTRTLKGGAKMQKGLTTLLEKRGDDLERVIGSDGVDNLYRIADLLKTPDLAQRTDAHLGGMGLLLRRHFPGVGALIGGVIGHGLGGLVHHGVGGYEGALAGAGVEAGYKKALHSAATNPKVAERLATASKRNILPKVAAPLIAAMMQGTLADKQQQDANPNP